MFTVYSSRFSYLNVVELGLSFLLDELTFLIVNMRSKEFKWCQNFSQKNICCFVKYLVKYPEAFNKVQPVHNSKSKNIERQNFRNQLRQLFKVEFANTLTNLNPSILLSLFLSIHHLNSVSMNVIHKLVVFKAKNSLIVWIWI